ncbi:sugar-binding transcriptional regulator [Christensenella timonensis]|uniref:sugar-binding transcriptional regulator n=1 Tax=Christensenella timonensis TaxID=1816678 RepID=UPI00083003C3|nr:sugar-binding transcriptional regulator [Christensenella timonensis]
MDTEYINVMLKTQKSTAQRRLMVRIAKMYYYDNMSQQAIADVLGISRSNVSRLLRLSREMDIVDIRINDASLKSIEISEKLKNMFHLKQMIVVPSNHDPNMNLSNIGASAARHIEKQLKDNMKVGVSWGQSVYQTIFHLVPVVRANVDIVQLMGGTAWDDSYMYGVQLILSFADKLGGSAKMMHSPLTLKSKQLRDMLLEEDDIKRHFDLTKNLDIAVIGIGSNSGDVSSMVHSNYITRKDSEQLWNNGIKCHICGRHIDMDGNLADIEYNDRVIGIELEDLKKIDNVIAIAGGRPKVEPIMAALRGGYIDTLVTDEETAILVERAVTQQ